MTRLGGAGRVGGMSRRYRAGAIFCHAQINFSGILTFADQLFNRIAGENVGHRPVLADNGHGAVAGHTRTGGRETGPRRPIRGGGLSRNLDRRDHEPRGSARPGFFPPGIPQGGNFPVFAQNRDSGNRATTSIPLRQGCVLGASEVSGLPGCHGCQWFGGNHRGGQ